MASKLAVPRCAPQPPSASARTLPVPATAIPVPAAGRSCPSRNFTPEALEKKGSVLQAKGGRPDPWKCKFPLSTGLLRSPFHPFLPAPSTPFRSRGPVGCVCRLDSQRLPSDPRSGRPERRVRAAPGATAAPDGRRISGGDAGTRPQTSPITRMNVEGGRSVCQSRLRRGERGRRRHGSGSPTSQLVRSSV